MKYHFKIHKEQSGYWAECIELDGLNTQGDTLEKLRSNMHEALHLFLDEEDDSDVLFKMPKKNLKGKNIEQVPVAPRLALAVMLRVLRKKNHFTQKQMAELIGLKGLFSYQRLENAKTANPEWDTLSKIKKVFPELDLDDLAA
ncbi:MAG: type II toxin-antitoxin system HicB family antitoxin [Pseudomonadota bacterium]